MSGRSKFTKEIWKKFVVSLQVDIDSTQKQLKWIAEKEKKKIHYPSTSINLFQTYQNHFFIILAWLCVPEKDFKNELNMMELRYYIKQCTILQQVNHSVRDYMTQYFVNKFKAFWNPLPLSLNRDQSNELGYLIWPRLSNVLNKYSFSFILNSYGLFCNLLYQKFQNWFISQSQVLICFPFKKPHLEILILRDRRRCSANMSIYSILDVAEIALLIYGTYPTYAKNKKIPKAKGPNFLNISKERKKRMLENKEKKNKFWCEIENHHLKEYTSSQTGKNICNKFLRTYCSLSSTQILTNNYLEIDEVLLELQQNKEKEEKEEEEEKERVQREEKCQIEKTERQVQLEKALERNGLTLRSDSRLCLKFIEIGTPTLDEVVEMMVEMAWFFKETKYAAFRQSIYSKSKQSPIRIDCDELSLVAKRKALEDYIEHQPKNLDQIPKSLIKKFYSDKLPNITYSSKITLYKFS